MADSAAWATSMMGGLPYFNPGMFINLSGTCATTKLIQCKNMGIYMCEITQKFHKDPEDVPDLHKEDFLARKKVVEAVQQWCGENEGKSKLIYKNEWALILYEYEIMKGSAKRLRDRGHLIFTDMTLTRFLLVMCFGESQSSYKHHVSFEDDYGAITRMHAQKFFSLLKYIHYSNGEPVFVRATYTTFQEGLHPEFLSSINPPTRNDIPIYHITADNFIPSLLPPEIERIDNVLTQTNKKVPSSEARIRSWARNQTDLR